MNLKVHAVQGVGCLAHPGGPEVESRGQIANEMLNLCYASASERRIPVSCVLL